MILPHAENVEHAVARRRAVYGWSQAELARRAGLPRTNVSAIEGRRLMPSVTAALALARTLECSVEDLFGAGDGALPSGGGEWAWPPRSEPCRYWEARLGKRRLRYPVEATAANPVPHDGVWRGRADRADRVVEADLAGTTLTLGCCDPSAGLLAAEYARSSGYRLLILPRGGSAALDLLQRGLVHVAGLHRSTTERPSLNRETVRSRLGSGHQMLRVAQWLSGVALPAADRTRSLRGLGRRAGPWAMRETGSAARECLDELLGGKLVSGRTVKNHAAVAEAVSAGWADAGVCVQLVAEEAGLNFLPVRTETLDFIFPESIAQDPRILALIRLLRSASHRRLIGSLPGYDTRETGELLAA